MKTVKAMLAVLAMVLLAGAVCGTVKAEGIEERRLMPFDGVSVRIDSAEALFLFAEAYNRGEDLRVITADGNESRIPADGVNLRFETDITVGEGFTPIGTKERPFSGEIDGRGNVLSVRFSGEDSGVFIASAKNAAIRNLTVRGEFYGNKAAFIGEAENLTVCGSDFEITACGKEKSAGVFISCKGDARFYNTKIKVGFVGEIRESAGLGAEAENIYAEDCGISISASDSDGEKEKSAAVAVTCGKLGLTDCEISGILPQKGVAVVFSGGEINLKSVKSEVVSGENGKENFSADTESDEDFGGAFIGRAERIEAEKVDVYGAKTLVGEAESVSVEASRLVIFGNRAVGRAEESFFGNSDVIIRSRSNFLFLGEGNRLELNRTTLDAETESFGFSGNADGLALFDCKIAVKTKSSFGIAGRTEVVRSAVKSDGADCVFGRTGILRIEKSEIYARSLGNCLLFAGEAAEISDSSITLEGGRCSIAESLRSFSLEGSSVIVVSSGEAAGIAFSATGEGRVISSSIGVFSGGGGLSGGIISEGGELLLKIEDSTVSGRTGAKISGGIAGKFTGGRIELIGASFALTPEGNGLPSEERGLLVGRIKSAEIYDCGKPLLLPDNGEDSAARDGLFCLRNLRERAETAIFVRAKSRGKDSLAPKTNDFGVSDKSGNDSAVFASDAEGFLLFGGVEGYGKSLDEINSGLAFLIRGRADLRERIIVDGTDLTPDFRGADEVSVTDADGKAAEMSVKGEYILSVGYGGEVYKLRLTVLPADFSGAVRPSGEYSFGNVPTELEWGGIVYTVTYYDENGVPFIGKPDGAGTFGVVFSAETEEYYAYSSGNLRISAETLSESDYPKIGYIPEERTYDGESLTAEIFAGKFTGKEGTVRLLYRGKTITGRSYSSGKAPSAAGNYEAVLYLTAKGYKGFSSEKAVDVVKFRILPVVLTIKPSDFVTEYDKTPSVTIEAEGLLAGDSLFFIEGYNTLKILLPQQPDAPAEFEIKLSGNLVSEKYSVVFASGAGIYKKRTQAPPQPKADLSFVSGGVKIKLMPGTEWAIDEPSFTTDGFIAGVSEGEHTVFLRFYGNSKAEPSEYVSFRVEVRYPVWEKPWFYAVLLAIAAVIFAFFGRKLGKDRRDAGPIGGRPPDKVK